jgi:hypothetical protein
MSCLSLGVALHITIRPKKIGALSIDKAPSTVEQTRFARLGAVNLL